MTGGVLTVTALSTAGSNRKVGNFRLHWLPTHGGPRRLRLIPRSHMVTAGVYMIRAHMFCLTTRLRSQRRGHHRRGNRALRGTIGLVQNDIKRVLATPPSRSWLHVFRLRRRRIFSRDLPPGHSRFLQALLFLQPVL